MVLQASKKLIEAPTSNDDVDEISFADVSLNEYGTVKVPMSQSVVEGVPKQRRRRGDRSGDKSSFVAKSSS